MENSKRRVVRTGSRITNCFPAEKTLLEQRLLNGILYSQRIVQPSTQESDSRTFVFNSDEEALQKRVYISCIVLEVLSLQKNCETTTDKPGPSGTSLEKSVCCNATRSPLRKI